jgi:hypothetical protein
MLIRIRIKTAPGHATSMSKKLRPFIFGVFNHEHKEELKVDKTDSIIIWKAECDFAKAMSIQKRVQMFDSMVKGVFDKKIVKRAIKKYCKPGDDEIVKKMLTNQTNVRILKQDEEDGF